MKNYVKKLFFTVILVGGGCLISTNSSLFYSTAFAAENPGIKCRCSSVWNPWGNKNCQADNQGERCATFDENALCSAYNSNCGG